VKHPWVAFYWGDYFADTVHLTQGQHGAYLLLLGRYHANGEPLQANDEQLQRICRANTKQERSNVAAVLSEFFFLKDERYHNNRADEELAKRSEISAKRSLAAKKKGSSKSTANEEQMHIQPQPHIQPQNLKSNSLGRDFSPEVFEIANIHPRIAHRKKGPSRIEQEVIAQAVAQDGRDLVLAGTRNLADAVSRWPKSELKYIPDPVKFYRDENYKLDPAIWDKSKPDAMAGKEGLSTATVLDDEPDAHTLALREKYAQQHRDEMARKKAATVNKI
jgi:uncharacterized protein YdaU (DUF1376 family)